MARAWKKTWREKGKKKEKVGRRLRILRGWPPRGWYVPGWPVSSEKIVKRGRPGKKLLPHREEIDPKLSLPARRAGQGPRWFATVIRYSRKTKEAVCTRV